MKHIIIITAAAALLASCNFISVKNPLEGQDQVSEKADNNNNSTMEKKNFEISAFDAIHTMGAFDVKYLVSETPSVQVTAKAYVMERLEVKVEDGVLVMNTSKGKPIRSDVKAIVTGPAVKSIQIDGAGDFEIGTFNLDGALKISVNGAGDLEMGRVVCEALKISVAGAGDVDIDNIQAQTLDISIAGAGDAKIGGSVQDANLSIAGAGDIDARNLEIKGNFNKSVKGLGKVSR